MLANYYSLNNSFFNEESVIRKRFDDNYWKNLKGNIILDTCHDFFSQTDENNFYDKFKPLPQIQKKIDKITQQFNDDVIGVHIRRSDNQQAIEISKEEFFVRRLEHVLEKNPNAQFFLSTDDISTSALFRSKFGKHIISFDDKVLNRNSPQGIQDAVVDLFALSRTKNILGSWWSSFGIIAASIGKIQLEIVKN
ncbi:MAG: hypothetical protein ACTHJN_01810 [Ginsengibacter sp.]